MKKIVSTLLSCLIVISVQGNTLYEQLCDFNPNWKKYNTHFSNQLAIDFQSDQAYIQTHLTHVIEVLETNPVSHLNQSQLESRQHLIQILDAYRIEGKFPINYYRQERIPVFIDEHNTHCAVGYLLMKTGHDHIAKRIAKNDNYIWVKDIKDEAIRSWQEASGFSLEELKLIQGAYDFYMPDALILPNRFEIPQKPVAETHYFGDKKKHVWFSGEGIDGVLHGKWTQNYNEKLPWIEGYYNQGKRTGKWMEFYQGTKLLCRTEIWKNDQLNGVRKRFDRRGRIIEEILFKNGDAITKVNYDILNGLKWVRVPLDSVHVRTKVYDNDGVLLASGHEKVHNPSGLLWFQNIELTALNSASITSREVSLGNTAQFQAQSLPQFQQRLPRGMRSFQMNNGPALVEYHKLGEWTYYKQWNPNSLKTDQNRTVKTRLAYDYAYFGKDLLAGIYLFDDMKAIEGFDSLKVRYSDNLVTHFYAHTNKDNIDLRIKYHELAIAASQSIYDIQTGGQQQFRRYVKTIGQYNKNHEKIGTWKHYDMSQILLKTEQFIVPEKDDFSQKGASDINAVLEEKDLSRIR